MPLVLVLLVLIECTEATVPSSRPQLICFKPRRKAAVRPPEDNVVAVASQFGTQGGAVGVVGVVVSMTDDECSVD